jgi:hypothetical protein
MKMSHMENKMAVGPAFQQKVAVTDVFKDIEKLESDLWEAATIFEPT